MKPHLLHLAGAGSALEPQPLLPTPVALPETSLDVQNPINSVSFPQYQRSSSAQIGKGGKIRLLPSRQTAGKIYPLSQNFIK